MNFLHYGIPTEHKIESKTYSYVEKIKLYVTNPDEDEFKLQYVWAEPDSPLPEIVKKEKHLSIKVENIDEAMKDFDYVAYPPLALNEKLKIGFAVKDNVLFELMELSN